MPEKKVQIEDIELIGLLALGKACRRTIQQEAT